MYQMIISEVKPDLIIEVGTRKGGGAYYLADLLDSIGNGVIQLRNASDGRTASEVPCTSPDSRSPDTPQG